LRCSRLWLWRMPSFETSRRSALMALVTVDVVPSSRILFTQMEAIRYSETSVLIRAMWRHIPEDGILHLWYYLWLCVGVKFVTHFPADDGAITIVGAASRGQQQDQLLINLDLNHLLCSADALTVFSTAYGRVLCLQLQILVLGPLIIPSHSPKYREWMSVHFLCAQSTDVRATQRQTQAAPPLLCCVRVRITHIRSAQAALHCVAFKVCLHVWRKCCPCT
jgi:hypothetical protein